MSYRIALVGNPNCGKTTMFNEITGSTQYVGNWPGVTVEKKEGKARKIQEDVSIVDLPGIYSLSPYSIEEIVARNYIIDEKPDAIINIVDASNIERNLYLTLQLLELGVPVIIALNMMDVVESRGDKIDIEKLQKALGVVIVPVVAAKGKGVFDAVSKAVKVAENAEISKKAEIAATVHKLNIWSANVEKAIEEIECIVGEKAEKLGYKKSWVALKFLEDDEHIVQKISIEETQKSRIDKARADLEEKQDDDAETVIADERYKFIGSVIGKAVRKSAKSNNLTTSDKIDKIVTNRILAIPLFLTVLFLVFNITFSTAGSFLTDGLDVLINEHFSGLVSSALESAGAAPWLHALIVDGIIAGVGSVLVFIPQIMILFFFISLLEDSGYMARAAFVMDKLLRKFGLSGKSFIPMIMGFGCSVPGVMAARTLEDEKDRKLTIMLTPFMSCGARLPVYALFAAAFFANNQSTVIFSIYVLGIVIAVLSGIILRKTVLRGGAAPFVMELPPYRIPTLKGIAIHMWDRAKGFLIKAGTVIFAACVIIWFTQSFSFGLSMVEDPGDSIMGAVGKFIAPVFAPLGFGDWKSAMTLITGVVAKEVVVATLGILNGIAEVGEDTTAIAAALQGVFTPLKAYAFMAFVLLYMPCLAAFGAIKREMNSWKWTIFTVSFQTGVAWIVAFLIYQGGRLIGLV